MPSADAVAPVAQAKVLLVDDHALLRTGVANIINQEPDLHVVAEAANGADAIEAFRVHRPDVTLLDLRMPVMEGVEAVRHIREIDAGSVRLHPDLDVEIHDPFDGHDYFHSAGPLDGVLAA